MISGRMVTVRVTACVLAGTGLLAGCGSPTSARTGTPADDATASSSPAGRTGGTVPHLSSPVTSTGSGRAGGNAVGVP